jgi:hypothetical protein
MYGKFSGALIAHNDASWDPAVLEPLAEINERVLEVLGVEGSALRPYTSALSPVLAGQWRSLDAAGRSRLAAGPYLLLDCRFSSPELWSTPVHAGVRDAARAGRGFASALGAATLRHVMLVAWHWSRANLTTAQIALGFTESCARLIASTRLRDLEALAELCPEWIRPRWENRPDIWRQLLSAAPAHPIALRHLQLRGLQLLAASGRGFQAQVSIPAVPEEARASTNVLHNLSAGRRPRSGSTARERSKKAAAATAGKLGVLILRPPGPCGPD